MTRVEIKNDKKILTSKITKNQKQPQKPELASSRSFNLIGLTLDWPDENLLLCLPFIFTYIV